MIITNAILDIINDALAANTDLWGVGTPAVHVKLIQNSFVPNPGILITDLVPASFTGSTPQLVALPPQTKIFDDLNGRRGILMKPSAGMFVWTCTAYPDAPQVMYGWAATDIDDTVVYASDLLPIPITIKEPGNFVEVPSLFAYQMNNAYGNLPAV